MNKTTKSAQFTPGPWSLCNWMVGNNTPTGEVTIPATPNLYVFLVGPSGSGKEQAIKVVLKLVSEQQSKVNPYAGKMTGPAMWEYLSKLVDRLLITITRWVCGAMLTLVTFWRWPSTTNQFFTIRLSICCASVLFSLCMVG